MAILTNKTYTYIIHLLIKNNSVACSIEKTVVVIIGGRIGNNGIVKPNHFYLIVWL
jgi:hypothetical protein